MPIENFGKSNVGAYSETQKVSGHPYTGRMHRAVIFAIAQLSCFNYYSGDINFIGFVLGQKP